MLSGWRRGGADLRFFLCYFLKSVCAITLMTRLFFFVMLIEFTAAHTPNGCIMVTGSLQCLPAESTSHPFRAPLAYATQPLAPPGRPRPLKVRCSGSAVCTKQWFTGIKTK